VAPITMSAVNLKIPKRRLDGQAADVLREQILSGRFAPGYRLVEAALADQLGVSRGTVRAALSELAHEGLVSQVAYTKWMVPELSAEDAWELYTLRGNLEGLAAKLATERRTPETMATLRDSYEDLEAAVASHRRDHRPPPADRPIQADRAAGAPLHRHLQRRHRRPA
jgi:DNA-binding GntR family transcriptional regulator